MLDSRAAAQLLAQGTSLHRLTPLAIALGFAHPIPLDAELGSAIGISPTDGRAAVAEGTGALRALLIESGGARPTRELTERLARKLTARAPQLLWTLIVTAPGTHELILAAWDMSRSPPRIRALTVDQRRVVDSDAATLRMLCASAPARDDTARTADVVAHAAWLDVLGRDALTRRFYRELVQVVGLLADSLHGPARPSPADRADFALLQLSRLLFLSFVEARGWLDGDPAFLIHSFERCMEGGGGFHRRVLIPLTFGTLNTPPTRRAPTARAFGRIPFLNGGLFARTPLERRLGNVRWDDAAMGQVFARLLGRYRFTAREDRHSWTDAAVDPELLGRAFESLMNSGTRRETGAFYTPPTLVAHTTREALASALRDSLAADGNGTPAANTALVEAALGGAHADSMNATRLLRAIRGLRVLDPACGSGAFLVHALETLADMAIRAGDGRQIATIRRELAASSIFGVDVNPMAVWLCELRLWLSVLMECDVTDPVRVPPLPNLDHHVRVGDALDGGGMEVPGRLDRADAIRLVRLRTRYTRASGSTKRALARALEREERHAAIARLDGELAVLAIHRRDLLTAAPARDLFGERTRPSVPHSRQLERLRTESRRLRDRRRALLAGRGLPFAFATHFADVAAAGGFGLVIGNPPWVRPHHMAKVDRRRLRESFAVARAASWSNGARLAGAGAGFGGQVDMAALFVERSLTLLANNGTMALLLPAKLWHSLSGGGVRELLVRETHIVHVEDWSDSPHSFDAAVYPSLVVAIRRDGSRDACTLARSARGESSPILPRRATVSGTSPSTLTAELPSERSRHPGQASVTVVEWRGTREERWRERSEALSFGGEPGAPWVLLPPAAHRAFELLRERGTPLALGPAGRPMLGVKTGCNDAYLFRINGHGEPVPVAGQDAELCELAARVEPSMLRPLLRGEDMRRWQPASSGLHILWPHDRVGRVTGTLPPGAAAWMGAWRDRLERRVDARRARRWWGVFRTEAAAAECHRVVWADMGREPRAGYVAAGTPVVPLNSCYVLGTTEREEALALTALLNSPIAAAWLAALAEPARGGYRRHMAWTLSLLPLPGRWSRARPRLASLAASAVEGGRVEDDALNDAVLRAFNLHMDVVAPLLEWAAG